MIFNRKSDFQWEGVKRVRENKKTVCQKILKQKDERVKKISKKRKKKESAKNKEKKEMKKILKL